MFSNWCPLNCYCHCQISSGLYFLGLHNFLYFWGLLHFCAPFLILSHLYCWGCPHLSDCLHFWVLLIVWAYLNFWARFHILVLLIAWAYLHFWTRLHLWGHLHFGVVFILRIILIFGVILIFRVIILFVVVFTFGSLFNIEKLSFFVVQILFCGSNTIFLTPTPGKENKKLLRSKNSSKTRSQHPVGRYLCFKFGGSFSALAGIV